MASNSPRDCQRMRWNWRPKSEGKASSLRAGVENGSGGMRSARCVGEPVPARRGEERPLGES